MLVVTPPPYRNLPRRALAIVAAATLFVATLISAQPAVGDVTNPVAKWRCNDPVLIGSTGAKLYCWKDPGALKTRFRTIVQCTNGLYYDGPWVLPENWSAAYCGSGAQVASVSYQLQ